MKISTKSMAIGGVFAAMVTVGTMIIRIPIPVGGYIHIGDSLVYLSGILLGPVLGGVASGVGSCIADILSGYMDYALATAFIKFLDAFVVGAIFLGLQKRLNGTFGTVIAYLLGVLAGGLVMIGGYFAFEVMMKGMTYALGTVGYNIAQAVGGAIIGLPILIALDKTKYFNRLNQMFK